MSFATESVLAVKVLHETFGVGCLFTAPPAAGISVRAIFGLHDPVVAFAGLETQARSPGLEAIIEQTDVPTRPRKGVDTLTKGSTVYQIRDVEEDVERTQWRLDIGE